jgi:hypothetical protein
MSPPPMNVVSVHFYPKYGQPPTHAEATGVEGVVARWKEFSDKIWQALFVGEFAPAAEKEKTLTMEQFRSLQTEILDALLKDKVALAAYWVFDYTKDRKGQGLVRSDNEYAWVIAQMVEYNEKIKRQLEQEGP